MQKPEADDRMRWKQFWCDTRQRSRFVIITAMLLVIVFCFAIFLRWVEGRDGYVMNDPVLGSFQPVDLSMITFAVTYFPVVAGVIHASHSPVLLMRIALSYAILLLLRMTTLWVVPLDPPPDIIPLRDPLLESTVYNGQANLRDLFFSGHTATHFIFFLLVKHKGVRMFFLMCTVFTGILVLMQHVHYTVDVLAAPAFAWLAVRASALLERA